MLKLSIIVPVYNVAQYLPKCLQSILRQGLSTDQYECLLINDGSTDNSRNICEEYVQNYDNFKLIDQKNQGVSIARNTGIDNAQGEFVCFIDSDDYLLDDGLNKAFIPFASRKDIDVISFRSSYDYWSVQEINNEVDYEGNAHNLIVRDGLPSFCWLFIYRRSFLNQEHIRFEKLIVCEDQLFSNTVMLANPKVLSTHANIYRYVVHRDSITTKRSKSHCRKCVDDYLYGYEEILNQMKHYDLAESPKVEKACYNSLNSKKFFLVTRVWSSVYNYSSFVAIRKRCLNNSFLPIPKYSKGIKSNFVRHILNLSMSSFIAYKGISFLFKYIISPVLTYKKIKGFKDNRA